MIKIAVRRDEGGHIVALKATGHSGFAPRGSDIVCAGVSSILQTAILGLQDVIGVEGLEARAENRKGPVGNLLGNLLSCSLPEDMDDEARRGADIILESALRGLRAIERKYDNYVKIVETQLYPHQAGGFLYSFL
ncbi:MAG: ribosomal-processing cysteine protease Prp [bacterium]